MDFATIVFIFIIFILAVLLLTSSAIGMKLYNEYNSLLSSAYPNQQNLHNEWEKSYKVSKDTLWAGIGIGAIIIAIIIFYIIYLLATGQRRRIINETMDGIDDAIRRTLHKMGVQENKPRSVYNFNESYA